MADSKQLQQVQDTSWDLVNSFRETSQTMADTLVALQDRNLNFMQSTYLSWMDLLTQQTESVQQWGQQSRKQQDAFQRLVSPSMSISMNPFPPPFSFWRQLVDSAEAGPEREREMVQQAPR
ncbi:MAG: hypothetical protein E6I97_15290 [Chloroflexi bacterium]|nr:MAG: hypothetical protein E6I97_15290 [Chloroflexota bacterium]